MSYYKLLGLKREPFSTSPDPDFFYQSKEHKAAFYRLHVAIDLKRGLNLILGDVGTGKSTLMRKLTASLSDESEYIIKVILDPAAHSERAFLSLLGGTFGLNPEFHSSANYKKAIEHYLFEEGMIHGRTVVLFIDEAHKLSFSALEVLRILLNYETNDMKLIQIVLFGQMELLASISQTRNLWDRLAFKYMINPLEENEIKELIAFRLRQAGYAAAEPLFTQGALRAVYTHTQGYPRRATILCHDALEYLVMHNRLMVDEEVIQRLVDQEIKPAGLNGRIQMTENSVLSR